MTWLTSEYNIDKLRQQKLNGGDGCFNEKLFELNKINILYMLLFLNKLSIKKNKSRICLLLYFMMNSV